MERLLNSLPDVRMCCFVLPLKIGCIIIAVWYLLVGTVVGQHVLIRNDFLSFDWALVTSKYTCFENIDKSDCPQNLLMKTAAKIIILVIDFSLRAASALLLVGILINMVKSATIFLYVYVITRTIDFVILLTMMCLSVAGSCTNTGLSKFNCMVTSLIVIVVCVYVVIVIKSYRSIWLPPHSARVPHLISAHSASLAETKK
ncbi:uncharacterized protein LOC135310047 [Plodia interpunctella]|uniref:uncharacterized protein LOC135310047 n=1 Tax=Plodia interpunctella TaxID=58824 RepID=UPI0031018906